MHGPKNKTLTTSGFHTVYVYVGQLNGVRVLKNDCLMRFVVFERKKGGGDMLRWDTRKRDECYALVV